MEDPGLFIPQLTAGPPGDEHILSLSSHCWCFHSRYFRIFVIPEKKNPKKLLQGVLVLSMIWIVVFTLMSTKEALDSVGLLNTGITCLYVAPKAPKALFEV